MLLINRYIPAKEGSNKISLMDHVDLAVVQWLETSITMVVRLLAIY